MANRLAAETSPYLLQHKDNPVDWYPWSDEAFAKARVEDKPIFLSVGYSSCHWCHVMEHESFENDDVAKILNRSFVSVKVDREERPDVDEAYMTAVQLSTGRGGWPMTLFLTPDRKPFFAGTYFPRENRGQSPGFLTICTQIELLWKTKRSEIEENAEQFSLGLAEALGQQAPSTFATFNDELLASAVKALANTFDSDNGGFGGAPKFPPHTAIDFLLRYCQREPAPSDLRELALAMAVSTLDQMALGGIRDHMGGGFHRYSTDNHWLLPHFEKMLYDNALMLSNYALASALVENADQELGRSFAGVAGEIAGWIRDEMTSEAGLFYSALDADSEGIEGKYYVWTADEIRRALPDAAPFMAAYGIKEDGNFKDEATGKLTGENILHMAPGSAEVSPQRDTEDREGFDAELATLRAARDRRVRPGLDDKSLVGWNGLMIRALADVGLVDRAGKAATAILDAERQLGFLPHQISRGEASGLGFLEDYAAFILGLFSLEETCRALGGTGDCDLWRREGERLSRRMIDLFWDDEKGGFFATSSEHEELFGRSKPVFDSPIPSGNALALRCLIEIGDFDRGWRLVNALTGWMERVPTATEALYAAALPLLSEDANRTPRSEPAAADTAHLISPLGGTAKVEVRLEPREIRADEKGVGRARLVIDVPPGMHINSHEPPARWLIPTGVRFEPVAGKAKFPPAPNDVYEGEVMIEFDIQLPSGSNGEDFEVTVRFQVCTETECQAPEERTVAGQIIGS